MEQLVILSGAGLSAESGIPTFRGPDGLWHSHKLEEVAYIETWKRNYELVHSFYNERREQIRPTQPNAAHRMIASWQLKYNTLVFTQNIDDLLEKAGAKAIHLHGSIKEMLCTACGKVWDVGYEPWVETSRCKCNSRRGVKPNVIFFGEQAPNYPQFWKVMDNLSSEITLLVIGTAGVVIPVNEIVKNFKGISILANLQEENDIDSKLFTKTFLGPATETVQLIDQYLLELNQRNRNVSLNML